MGGRMETSASGGRAAKGWRGLRAVALGTAMAVLGAAGTAVAAPYDWQLGMQPAVTPMQARIESLHDVLLVIITGIALFVMALLAYVIVKFRASVNPVPSRTTHNTTIEVLWTIVPVLILVTIAVPSFRLLYYADKTRDAQMTIKVTGHQWYWSYQFPDQGNLTYDSYMIQDADRKPGQLRLLDVDNKLVLPTDTNIRILITSSDVMHSWFAPSLGVQRYAMPGRINETWVRIDKPGQYYGQCNQICGVNHSAMPISIEALPKDKFDAWVKDAQKKFADGSAPAAKDVRLAAGN